LRQVIGRWSNKQFWIFTWCWLPSETYVAAFKLKCRQFAKYSYSKLIGHRGSRCISSLP
jgi:hypothetical protein